MNTEPLDYELVETEYGEWQLWTPDVLGAVLGAGTTKTEAIANAFGNMLATLNELYQLQK